MPDDKSQWYFLTLVTPPIEVLTLWGPIFLYPRDALIVFGVAVADVFMSSRAYQNPLKATITTVTLSRLLLFNAFFIIHSAPVPSESWRSGSWIPLTVFQTQSTQSQSLNLSKIPSHPRITKSWDSSSLNDQISGQEITTWEVTFASKSPKVQHTDNHPGKTLTGPMIISGGICFPFSSHPWAIVAVWYIYPFAAMILCFS